MYDYQVAVLGGGPGGYVAAIRAAQYGRKTALIESGELGGTCLNRGCIPTKALLHGAHTYQEMLHAERFGISAKALSLDYQKLAAHKDEVVKKLVRGIAALEKAHGVEVIKGFGTLADAHTILVEGRAVRAEQIILATGCTPSMPPIPGIENAINSDAVLQMEACPEDMIIIGGGVIGIEFASLFSALGKRVTILEALPDILSGMDAEITAQLKRKLKKDGVKIMTGARVSRIEKDDGVYVTYSIGDRQEKAGAACCIVCTGRKPMTQNIGLEKLGVAMERGYVTVDARMRTSIPHIYAIGDITGKAQLAHVASAQAMVAAAACAGKDGRMRYDVIPACVYTNPEIAQVGLTEKQALEQGKNVVCGRFDVAGNGRSMACGESVGFVKLVADRSTGEIYGAQLFAPRATDMLAEICAVMRSEGTIDELADTIHPHPTFSEMLMEAAHDAQGHCCHRQPRKHEKEINS